MKVLLVYPRYPDTFWSFKHALKFVAKKAAHPPLGLLGRVAQRAIAGDIPQVAAERSLKRLKALCES